ncbi:MAG: L,D-transpeptidase [Verrucomicrobiales bacterium]
MGPWGAGVLLFALAVLPTREAQAQVPRDTRQVIVAVAPGWNDHRARLQGYERVGGSWRPLFAEPIPVLLGRSGLAWGRGVHQVPRGHSAPVKRERDGRAPAGCFAIGSIYGYAPRLPSGASFRYRQVTRWDAWVDDPANPYYNRHLVIDPRKVPPWFESQKMRHGDAAYAWLVEIRHNSDPPVPGAGSAIFFHIRRGEDRATAGCTSMEESNLVRMIRWLRADGKPHYVLLPAKDYEGLKRFWGLPDFPT